MRRRFGLVLLFACVAGAALLGVSGGGAKPAAPAAAQARATSPTAIPLAARSLVSASIGRRDVAYHAVRAGQTVRLRNTANSLRGTFAPSGLKVHGGGATLDMSLAGYGRPG